MARLILCFYILVLCKCINTNVDIQPNKENPSVLKEEQKHEDKQKLEEVPVIKVGNAEKTNEKNIDLGKVDKKNKVVLSTDNITTANILTNTSTNKNNAEAEIESGAVMRGIFVFVGITLLFIMYIAFKTYRRGNRKNVIIKKYGVRTRRSDVEMEPLPLDEDEEDETVFDLGNVNNR